MVRLANPIYDSVFKHLMENRVVAHGLLSALLQTEIHELEPQPQELTDRTTFAARPAQEDVGIRVFRLDFAATITAADGSKKKVLIELQKAGKDEALSRFRGYLGKHYAIPPKVAVPLPIVAIYFLGFWLNKSLPKAVRVNRRYTDIITGAEVTEREDFIEQLTHDAVVVQIPALPSSKGTSGSITQPRTEVELALELFNQEHRTPDHHFIQLTDAQISQGPPWVQEMFKVLSFVAADPETQAQMQAEDEVTDLAS
jgi:hypothetical protein